MKSKPIREPKVTGIAQCPECEHIQPLYTMRTNKHFVRCFNCAAPKREDARDSEEIPRYRMRVRWLETDMPESLWKEYFKQSQLV
jgi:hypothetical protein